MPVALSGSRCRKCGASGTYLRWSTGTCDNADACRARERVVRRRADIRALRAARDLEVANG